MPATAPAARARLIACATLASGQGAPAGPLLVGATPAGQDEGQAADRQ